MASASANTDAAAGAGAAGDYDPLALLKQELADDNPEVVIAAAQRISLIAVGIGPQRTREELFPFLQAYVELDNEEALVAVGQQLGVCARYVGGAEQVESVLPLLEQLASADETVVRDAAVRSLQTVVPRLPPAVAADKVVGMIKRLANADWLGSRMSACGLFAVIFRTTSPEMQHELVGWFTRLCNDDTPMVRKAAYENLGAFARVVNDGLLRSNLIPVLKTLVEDPIDSTRLNAVEPAVDMCAVVPEGDLKELVAPLLEKLHVDPSWRVRMRFASLVDKMYTNTKAAVGGEVLVPMMAKLLTDHEIAVRLESARNLKELADKVVALAGNPNGSEPVARHIVPLLDRLCTDDNDKVRCNVSIAVPHLALAVGVQHIDEMLIPAVLVLAKDGNQEVRHSMLSQLNTLINALADQPKVIERRILPMLLELSKDVKWRVRKEVVGLSNMISRVLGKEMFEQKIRALLIGGLSDNANAIREEAAGQIAELAKAWGVEWLLSQLLPEVLQLFNTATNYLHRISILTVVSAVCTQMAPELVEQHLLPVVLKACGDEVPNVRFYAAKTMLKVVPVLGTKARVESNVVPKLTLLTRDSDSDAQYFSEQALKACQQLM